MRKDTGRELRFVTQTDFQPLCRVRDDRYGAVGIPAIFVLFSYLYKRQRVLKVKKKAEVARDHPEWFMRLIRPEVPGPRAGSPSPSPTEMIA